ncbi:LacI family DNA-binding transcriptional regulator [Latilactobacillus graminis]|uniref:Bacterial regulatory s, lacI family protein n=2 Tax=Latilactobacillus graminis TaxID=60519 RepID=A0AA89L4F6_9LACO|nr:LacI family DNA-binding transcriptional regulator [Latilactobacillus graminis]KRM20984.1 bacterial regulatory s, lacI family protein [Latilactobacillus graminis DSM 20719]QFP79124.1 LacI family DNA-binding transcriptional regulator [Latilactobacillus graminis]
MATIRDIARKSGYSVTTVSRVLNHQKYVSPAAKAAIEAVIEQLDYVPNSLARDLSFGQNKNIGVVLPHNDHPYFNQLLNGIMDAAFSSGYHIVLLPSEYNQTIELDYLEQLKRKNFTALIFASHGLALSVLEDYTRYGQIVCCENPGQHHISAVYSHREPAYLAAFNYLKIQQVTQMGLLLSRNSVQSPTWVAVTTAYQQVFSCQPDAKLMIGGMRSFEDGYHAAKHLIAQQPTLNCYFTNGDDIAAGVRQYHLDHQLAPPLLIGQEKQLSSLLLKIPTIDHHFFTLGQKAFAVALSNHHQICRFESEFILC